MIEVRATTEIAAPAAVVWRNLVELCDFHAWNPFIREAYGSTDIGGTVWVRVKTSFGLPLAFHARVIDSEPEHELHWLGHVVAPWFGAGEHWFTIEPIGDARCKFEQRERFTGIVPRLLGRLAAPEVQHGFDAMNHALAARAEAQHRAGAPS